MEQIGLYLFFTGVGFISGSVVYSYFLPRFFLKKDIVAMSSDRNPGCANVFKYAGIPMGIVCLLCDFFKGFLPVLWASHALEENNLLFSAVVAAPAAGHLFSPFLCFRGGKAINVSFGSLTALLPRYMTVWWLVLPFLLLSTIFRLNPHSLRVAVSFSVMFILSVLFDKVVAISFGALLVCILVVTKHLYVYFKQEHKSAALLFFNHTLWNSQKL